MVRGACLWVEIATAIAAVVAMASRQRRDGRRAGAERRVEELEADLVENAAAREALAADLDQTWLWNLQMYSRQLACRDLAFDTVNTAHDRITIYANDGSGFFTMLARVATNPDLQTRGRARIPAEQGIIGTAWRDGDAWEPDLPDPFRPSLAWQKRQVRLDLPPETVAALRMMSRCYYARRLDTTHDVAAAVIVVESMAPNRWRLEDLRTMFGPTHQGRYFGPFFDRMQGQLPSLTDAAKRGV